MDETADLPGLFWALLTAKVLMLAGLAAVMFEQRRQTRRIHNMLSYLTARIEARRLRSERLAGALVTDLSLRWSRHPAFDRRRTGRSKRGSFHRQ
jgi:hypothetical protein